MQPNFGFHQTGKEHVTPMDCAKLSTTRCVRLVTGNTGNRSIMSTSVSTLFHGIELWDSTVKCHVSNASGRVPHNRNMNKTWH